MCLYFTHSTHSRSEIQTYPITPKPAQPTCSLGVDVTSHLCSTNIETNTPHTIPSYNQRKTWPGLPYHATTGSVGNGEFYVLCFTTPGSSVICWLNLLVLFSALTGFSPGTLVFPSPQKLTYNLIRFIWFTYLIDLLIWFDLLIWLITCIFLDVSMETGKKVDEENHKK